MSARLRRFAILLALWPVPALAWGPEGHEIVAALAARELTPPARAQVSALLDGEAGAMMVANADWADEIRDRRPETSAWHFVNIELDSTGYVRARDCPGDDCVVAQIEKDRALAADPRDPRPRRAEALIFLIHLVGDIHQPLHAIDDHDRGGNDIQVRLGGYRTSMHHLWDTNLVEALGNDEAAIANQIVVGVTPAQKTAWQSGAPAGWANESFAVARQEIYARLGPHDRYRPVRLPRDYVAVEAPVVRLQLAKAGMRLAWLLNGMFR